ncbi:MAG: hypothetical protein ABI042_01540 [Verrucomicrobiota bacterium]
MGLLNLFTKKGVPNLAQLASGSFTVDARGGILASTLPHSFSPLHMSEIAFAILEIFADAKQAAVPLTELVIRYGGFKITARALRGGAIIFLKPKGLKPYNS